jgi:hypothetical protein
VDVDESDDVLDGSYHEPTQQSQQKSIRDPYAGREGVRLVAGVGISTTTTT